MKRLTDHPCARVLLSVCCLSLGLSSAQAETPRSVKRGIGLVHASMNDLKRMHGYVNWWYNWSIMPANGMVQSDYEAAGEEFVPMTWGRNFNEPQLRAFLSRHPSVRYLLAFNEPNFAKQANMTPQQVAKAWPKLEAIADHYHLKIVAPAVNYSPGHVDIPGTTKDGNPFLYLDAFFDACPNCRVDYIAVHSYMGSAKAVEHYVQRFYQRYHKPIWLTEWNLNPRHHHHQVDTEKQMNFMAKTVRWLENQPYVYRYAWFVGRRGAYSPKRAPAILAGEGQWTSLGNLYRQIPGPDYRFAVPGILEAEAAHGLSGFNHQLIPSVQPPSAIVLHNLRQNAQLTYQLQCHQAVTVPMAVRYASQGPVSLQVRYDGNPAMTLTLPNSGHRYQWQTSAQVLKCQPGAHSLTIQVARGQVSLDKLKLESAQ